MKITGAEFKEWFRTGLPTGFYLDSGMDWVGDDEEEKIADDELFDPDERWVLLWDGPRDEDPTDGEGVLVSTAIRRWRKQRDTEVLVVTVPKAHADEVRKMIKAVGGKVR